MWVYYRERTKREQIRAKEEGISRECKLQKARVREHKRKGETSVWPCILTAWKMERADQGRMLSLQCANISPNLKEPSLFFLEETEGKKWAFKESSLTS